MVLASVCINIDSVFDCFFRSCFSSISHCRSRYWPFDTTGTFSLKMFSLCRGRGSVVSPPSLKQRFGDAIAASSTLDARISGDELQQRFGCTFSFCSFLASVWPHFSPTNVVNCKVEMCTSFLEVREYARVFAWLSKEGQDDERCGAGDLCPM